MIAVIFNICLLFVSPGLSLLKNLTEILKNKKIKDRIIYIALSLAIFGWAINLDKINPGGDISRYFLEMDSNNFQNFKTFISIEKYRYNFLYYLTLFSINKFEWAKNTLPLIYSFFIYYFLLKSINLICIKNNMKEGYVYLSIFLFVIFFKSPYSIYSGVKTALCLNVINYGLTLLYINRKKGYIYLLVGSLIHNSGWIILILFCISKFFKVSKKKMLVLGIQILILKKYVFMYFLSNEWTPYYIKALINVYVYGEWRNILVADKYGIYFLFKAIFFIIFIIFIIFIKKDNKAEKNEYFLFIRIYLIFVIVNFDLRMIIVRFILGGYIFFIPLIIEWIKNSKFKTLLLILLAFVFFDLLTFVNYGFKIGQGFPINIFEPTYNLIFNYIVK